jgi:hypothetical protein
MGTAFTPGLAVTDNATITKKRLLPIRGEVLVRVGEAVQPDTIIARAEIPGTLAVVKATQALGCAAEQLKDFCRVNEGDTVTPEQLLAERSVLFGLFKNRCRSPREGTVEYISKLSGNVGVRGKPRSITRNAYVAGKVVKIIEGEGAVIETRGAYIQGIFGVSGERHGRLEWLQIGDEPLAQKHLDESHRGKILLHRGRIDRTALPAAAQHGVLGLVGAGIVDSDLMDFLGFNIGVAITGEEEIPFTLILTEGFGEMAMPDRTIRLLRSLSGSQAAINGATQIRAGVIRPEIIVPRDTGSQAAPPFSQQLQIGTRVRLIRRPNFGRIGRVSALPDKPVLIATGSKVRVLSVKLDDGSEVTVPRANVEILD